MILVCVSGIFLFSWLFLQVQGNGKKYFVIASCIILLLYAALRAHNLQPDIPVYVEYFRDYSKMSFNEMIKVFEGDRKDPFYFFFAWCFSRIFPDAQLWLAFVALSFMSVVGVLIYKESENPLLSFIAFLALAYFEFSLSGLRQTLALSLTMLSYFGIKKKDWKMFVLLVLLASLFHKSALIFLIAYPVAHLKLGKGHLFIAIIIIAFFLVGKSYIRDLLQKYLIDTQYESYIESTVNLSFSGFIIQGSIFLFSFYYYSRVIKKYKNANILYNLSFIGLMFQLFSSMIAEIFRISMYFSIFNILLIPLAISVEEDLKTRFTETIGVGLILIVYMFMTGIPQYAFFWS